MNVNYLSKEQIDELSNRIAAKVENVYVGIAVWMGGDPVEPFTLENYQNLAGKFLKSGEVRGDNPERYVPPAKLLSDLQADLTASLSTGATPAMVTTLLKAFVFIKRKNAAPTWMFVFYEEPPKQPQTTKHNSSSKVLSPSSSIGQPSPRIPQQQLQRNQRGKGRDQQEPQRIQQPRLEYGQVAIRTTDTPRSHLGPSMFFTPFSTLNSYNAKVVSSHGVISPKPSSVEAISSRKSAFINLIKESIQSRPYLKLIVDKSNGHISIMNIDPDEVFITSEFQFCPLHSGRTADSFQPISMDIVSRLSSDCCGYITADADCFDMCYKCVSTVIDDAETAEINKQRENIKTILKTLTAEIEAFNSKCARLDNAEREQIQAKQRAIVEKKRFEVELGSSEDSIQNMQHLITHAYFNKIKKINTERRKDFTEEVPPEIPVMSYTPLSSFFDNFENIVNQMEDVTFSFTICGVTIPFDRRYTSIVLANYNDAKTTINEGRYKVVKVKHQGITVLQLEFHGVNITLNPNDSSVAMRHLTFSRDPNNVEYAFADISISPVYTDVSYQKLTLNLGKILATSLGIVEFITDRLDVYQYLGACFLSDYSEIIDALREVEVNPDRMRKYSIVHTNDVNRCDISFIQIESIRSEISEQLQTRSLTDLFEITLISDLYEITLMSGEDYEVKIAVEKSVALEILEDLSNFPKFEQTDGTDNINVILTDNHSKYVIPIDEIDSFLNQIRSNLDDLSTNGKKSTITEDHDEISRPQTSALTAANLVANGWTENGWIKSTSQALDTKETEFDFGETFSNISFVSKKSQKQRRAAKKAKSVDDEKSETGTQISGKTGITMLTGATTNYNRTYFGDSFDVMGYSFTGYDAEILSNKYYMIKGADFESRVAKLRISRLPLIEFNAEYIKATLFAEEAASEVPWFMEHGDNFTLLLIMVLFGSNAHHFRFPNEEEKKLKYQLDKLNPYTYKSKLSFGIPLSQANKGRQLRKFADKMETIDKIMIQTKKKTIETLGAEIADVVFTGIIQNGQYVNFENRDITIPTAGRVMETRIRLIGEYENHILPFIAECLADDQLNNGDQLIYYNIRDFVVFSTEIPKESVRNDSIIPGIPLYSTFNPNAIRTRSIFDSVVDRYAVDSQRLSALHTTQADINLRTVMRILFSDVTSVSLREVIPAMDDIIKTDLDVEITANKFGSELILLSLTSKFSQLVQQLKLNHQDPVVTNLLLQLDEVETFIKWILTNAIGRKAVNDIPSQKDFPGYVQELLQLIETTLGEIPAKVIDGRTHHLLDLYRAFVDAFSGVPQVLIERRSVMMNYVITLMSNIHDVRVGRNLELEREIKYASFGDSIPKGSSIYDVAQQNITDLISIMKSRKTDDAIRVKVGFPSEKLDVYLRYKIFLKFRDLLLAAPTKVQFNNIMKSIPYYLTTIAKKILRDSKQDIYDFYLTTNLGSVMSSIHSNTMALLKQEQGVMITELPLIFKIREDKDSANLVASKAKSSIESLKIEIERDRQVLIDKFVQYASIIDVIVNTYKSRKQSYDKKDSSFDDLIKDLMTNLDFIRRDYDNVKNLDVRIILSIFDDNSRIFNLRRRIFREFKFDQNSIDTFGECFTSAVGIFVANYKSSSEDQVRILNEQLSAHGMTLESSIAELEKKLTQVINSVERNEMNKTFIICRIAQYLFDMISVESMRIKDKLFTKRIEKFSVPHKQSQPRIAGYGSLLNTGLDISPPIVDVFTYNDIQTLGKNINQFLESILNGLSTIDCGPGMHTLSDLLEHFINYIRDLYVGNNDTQELQNVRKKYELFIKVADKSVNDIINSSEFDTFVNIINGTFNSLDATISSIPYFRNGEMPYPVRQNVTTNFFRGILLTIYDVISAGEMRIADLLRHISNNTGTEYSFENVDSLLSNISEMNDAVITFIDEYVDEKGQIIDPESVCELRRNYYLTTTGEFMNRMFEKLNYCIRRYIYEKETQFKVRVVDRLRVYIELFNAKMNLLKNLEKFIMMR